MTRKDERSAPDQVQPASDRAFIEISEVSKSYVRGAQVNLALQKTSFKIERGEFVSLVGPSGCGKTTLLKMIAGLSSPSSGSVWLNGTEVRGSRRDIGIVFQSPTLLPWRTVMSNILLPIEVLGRSRKEYRARARELLEMVGLDGYANHHPWELSGGMQQRVGICRALVHDPSVLLMDEPFAALDAITRESLNRELLDIWRASNKTIVFVTHSIAEAIFLSDRVVVMQSRPGRIRQMLEIHTDRATRASDQALQAAANQVRELLSAP